MAARGRGRDPSHVQERSLPGGIAILPKVGAASGLLHAAVAGGGPSASAHKSHGLVMRPPFSVRVAPFACR